MSSWKEFDFLSTLLTLGSSWFSTLSVCWDILIVCCITSGAHIRKCSVFAGWAVNNEINCKLSMIGLRFFKVLKWMSCLWLASTILLILPRMCVFQLWTLSRENSTYWCLWQSLAICLSALPATAWQDLDSLLDVTKFRYWFGVDFHSLEMHL